MPAVERKLMKVIAILDRSAGNDSVGEMWKETVLMVLSELILFYSGRLKDVMCKTYLISEAI